MQKFVTDIVLVLIFSFSFITGYSQRCLTSLKKEKALVNHPELAQKLKIQEAVIQQWITDQESSPRPRAIETIPVVVHVLWRVNEENISDEQIKSQLDILNKDFRKLNANFKSGPAAFQTLGADIELEFCLASVDPAGRATNGITRRRTTINNIGETENWHSTQAGGQDAWDVDKYLNIWVCDIGDDGTLGFASLPETADPPESDGLVIGHQYFGTVGTAAKSEPNHLGRTTTHEVGHYFNLEHLWGPEDGGCNEDDFVHDTPNQDYESEGCPEFPVYDDCTASGNGIMFNNYMDYSDDPCMTMFTKGQKMRMLAALHGPRACLLSSPGCDLTTHITENFIIMPGISPNPARNNLVITFPNPQDQESTCIIYNSTGKKMAEFKIIVTREINISGFPAGIYFLTSSVHPGTAAKFIIVN